MSKNLIILVIVMLFFTGCSLRRLDTPQQTIDVNNPSSEDKTVAEDKPNIDTEINEPLENEDDQGETIEEESPLTEQDKDEVIDISQLIVVVEEKKYAIDGNSIGVIVNKNIRLVDGFVPEGLFILIRSENPHDLYLREVLRDDLIMLLDDAKSIGLRLTIQSAYRSYDRQKTIYDRSLKTNGKEYTDRYIAFPGTSEHQTGLAVDFSSSRTGYTLDESFGNIDEGIWLRDNAHKYGFVLRYPKGKEYITGYGYEPWHFRYIGKELALSIYEQDVTLEEFYGLE